MKTFRLFKGVCLFVLLLMFSSISLYAQYYIGNLATPNNLNLNGQDDAEAEDSEIEVTYESVSAYMLGSFSSSYLARWEPVFANGSEIESYLVIETDEAGNTTKIGVIEAGDTDFFNNGKYELSNLPFAGCLKIRNTNSSSSGAGEFLTVSAAINPTISVSPFQDNGYIDFSDNIAINYGNGICNESNHLNTDNTELQIDCGFHIDFIGIIIKPYNFSCWPVLCNPHFTTNNWQIDNREFSYKGEGVLYNSPVITYNILDFNGNLMKGHQGNSGRIDIIVYVQGKNASEYIKNDWIHKSFVLTTASASKTSLENPTTPFINIFPNPCQSYTNIAYTLAEDSEVCIEVYNIQGEQVACINNNEYQLAGEHRAEIDMSHLANGTYICRVSQSNGEVSSQRFVKMH